MKFAGGLAVTILLDPPKSGRKIQSVFFWFSPPDLNDRRLAFDDITDFADAEKQALGMYDAHDFSFASGHDTRIHVIRPRDLLGKRSPQSYTARCLAVPTEKAPILMGIQSLEYQTEA